MLILDPTHHLIFQTANFALLSLPKTSWFGLLTALIRLIFGRSVSNINLLSLIIFFIYLSHSFLFYFILFISLLSLNLSSIFTNPFRMTL